ncbi:nucleotidyltransferase family protein [Halonatronum saccharophilum]|uniref:nucleotidyltransferase family protein n=1 Tax=Halonatronum saccharophilum TaxID=150060 RepID=UPI00048621FE|nr:nucleotidyltransferase family protein [Halonatronum saccharophilum]
MGVDAVVLAGARNDGDLAGFSDQDYEALIEINKRPMIEYVIESLRGTPLIDRIIVVGPGELNVEGVNQVITAKGDLVSNIELGLKASLSPYTLIISSDIPLITPEAIESFLVECEEDKAAFYYPIVRKEVLEASFPQSNRTYFSLEEGVFSGGNIFLVNGEILLQLTSLLEGILKWRKQPWKMAYLLGFKFIIKLLTGKLSISLIEEELFNLTGYLGKAIVLDHPEVGFDVDKLEHFIMAENIHKSSDTKSG